MVVENHGPFSPWFSHTVAAIRPIRNLAEGLCPLPLGFSCGVGEAFLADAIWHPLSATVVAPDPAKEPGGQVPILQALLQGGLVASLALLTCELMPIEMSQGESREGHLAALSARQTHAAARWPGP